MPESPIQITTILETDDSLHMEHLSSAKLSDMIFALLKGKNLQEIIDFGYKLLGNPPLLVAESTLVASPPNCGFANSTFLDMLQRTDPGCREPLYLMTEREFKEKQQRANAPLLIDCKHLGLRLIAAKVMYQGAQVAVLQVPESERMFRESDILYVHILATFISSELDNPTLGNEFSDMLFRTKFLGLLEGNAPLPNYKWLHLLQEKESPTLCICVLRLSSSTPRLPTTALNGGHYFCKGVFFQDDYVCLCTVSGSRQREAICSHFASLAKAYHGTAGISTEFTNSERILSYYRQAKFTLEAGFALHGPGRAYLYDRMSMEVILFDASCHIRTKRYYQPLYALLRDADEKRGSELTHTLQTYIAANADKSVVNKLLNLHRNTLNFRLHCIESVLGWSISEGTAFYILKIMEQLRENQGLIERVGTQWNTRSNPPEHFPQNS